MKTAPSFPERSSSSPCLSAMCVAWRPIRPPFRVASVANFLPLVSPSTLARARGQRRRSGPDEATKSTVQKLPLLTVRAGPRDGEEWVKRLKEEYMALITVSRVSIAVAPMQSCCYACQCSLPGSLEERPPQPLHARLRSTKRSTKRRGTSGSRSSPMQTARTGRARCGTCMSCCVTSSISTSSCPPHTQTYLPSLRCPTSTARRRKCTEAARSASTRTSDRCGRGMCHTLALRMRWRSGYARSRGTNAAAPNRHAFLTSLLARRHCAQMGPWLAVEIPSLIANGKIKKPGEGEGS